ncbi:unnamed protein product, partial [Soboliphyme baturini]|uniref:Calsequestrin n=1 Tax=Soboliphyme baturini TaxID=241478 RepID=A0A183ICE6_9BILA
SSSGCITSLRHPLLVRILIIINVYCKFKAIYYDLHFIRVDKLEIRINCPHSFATTTNPVTVTDSKLILLPCLPCFTFSSLNSRVSEVEKGEDTVHVYKDGYKIEYFGIVDPHYFVSWILDIPDDPLVIINSKHTANEWSSLKDSHVRMIGYFSPGSEELKDFEEAAEDFMGEIRFFAVVDTFWARSMGITKLGEVRMYRPFDSNPLVAPHTVDTEEEFEEWVNENREPVMQQLTYENYFNVWKDPEPDERMIVAFCDDEEEDGEALFNLLKQINRDNAQYAGRLEILLIDPDDFPLMIDEWESMFGIEIEEGPQLGLVDISDREGVWFDMTQLNLKESNEYEAQNLEVLQAWIDQIMEGSINNDFHESSCTSVRKRGEL